MRRVRGLLRRAGLGEQVATAMALLATESPRQEVVTPAPWRPARRSSG
jgi:hypothetical protein